VQLVSYDWLRAIGFMQSIAPVEISFSKGNWTLVREQVSSVTRVATLKGRTAIAAVFVSSTSATCCLWSPWELPVQCMRSSSCLLRHFLPEAGELFTFCHGISQYRVDTVAQDSLSYAVNKMAACCRDSHIYFPKQLKGVLLNFILEICIDSCFV
jgi:hypothetical protein